MSQEPAVWLPAFLGIRSVPAAHDSYGKLAEFCRPTGGSCFLLNLEDCRQVSPKKSIKKIPDMVNGRPDGVGPL